MTTSRVIDFENLLSPFRIEPRRMLPKWVKASYQEIPQEKEEANVGEVTSTNNSPKHSYRIPYIIPGTLIIIILFLLSITICVVHLPPKPQWSSCGDTPETARERGCSFDLMSFAWQLPECYDAHLVDEFAEWEPWTFWTDQFGNETVPLEMARTGDLALWVTWHYHLVHCTFVWKQMHRAYEAGWIDSHLRNYDHTLHCQRVLLMDCQDEGRDCALPDLVFFTKAVLKYPACEKVDHNAHSTWDGFQDSE